MTRPRAGMHAAISTVCIGKPLHKIVEVWHGGGSGDLDLSASFLELLGQSVGIVLADALLDLGR